VVVGIIVFLYFKSKKYSLSKQQSNGLKAFIFIVFLQFALGVLTLLYGVPMWLGLTHQIMAFILLATMTYTLHRLSK
jgi:cytochrome c oxidase assembly protein subunit 15